MLVSGQPSISVIVPVYNGAGFLRQSLEALACSTVKPLEVIVVDDCSTDNSIDVCLESDVRLFSTPQNSGPAVARNLGAEVAKGDVLLFVDADVLVKPETVGQMVTRFENDPEVSAVFGSYDDEPGETNFHLRVGGAPPPGGAWPSTATGPMLCAASIGSSLVNPTDATPGSAEILSTISCSMRV